MTEGTRSLAEILAMCDAETRLAQLADMPVEMLRELETRWPLWRRPDQAPPGAGWRTWLVMAGRGFGKTRIGAEWIRAQAEAYPFFRIALVGATMADVRRVMVEGESGLLAIAPRRRRPKWEPSLARLTWPGGAEAYGYSAAEPDSLRGPQHHAAWADEIAKWPEAQVAWDNLAMTMRTGSSPRVVATTTPRPVPLVRKLVAEAAVAGSTVAITRGRTVDNRAHLSTEYLAAMTASYAGTRVGRQELDGELIDDAEDALWTRSALEACRVRTAPTLRRVVVGVDPPGGAADGNGDACGIVAVALGEDGRGYVIEDASVGGVSPGTWAAAVAGCAERHRADRVIAEKNNGGEMVRSVLSGADAALPIRLVHASRGKVARAEPVLTLYEAGRVSHVGAFPALEDELCGLLAGGGYEGPGRSPDRADALVWALTELMLGPQVRASVRSM